MATEQINKKTKVGVVVSDKMDKTIVVETERVYRHPEFKRILKTKKKYKVHDEQALAKLGDIVEIYEGRPASKTKYMYLMRVIKPSASVTRSSGE
ncbi:30S ribosomal protein S17 [Candidatus Dependentiae bacterium Noda2021]|nr:30S ribosomal protein S17 [Candidatus Dependentiae bacterium Noda2021]